MADPVSSRPHMPGYGILGPDQGSGLLPWSWARDRLERSRYYWVATVGPAGRPHVMPVWGVWCDDAVWFSSSPSSRKSRNLTAGPEVVVTTDDPRQPVVVEGQAQRRRARADLERFTAVVNAKYDSDLPVAFFADNACFCVPPRRVIALDEADFVGSPTRWDFGAGA